MEKKLFKGVITEKTAQRFDQSINDGMIESIFNHTFNIVLNQQLPNIVTLGDSAILSAPNSIYISHFEELLSMIEKGQECLMKDNYLTIFPNIKIFLHTDTNHPFEETLENPSTFNRTILEENLAQLNHLSNKYNPYFKKPSYLPFYQQLVLESKALVTGAISQEWDKVTYHGNRMIGLGVGLTPSGDDFLTALLLVTHYFPSLKHQLTQSVFSMDYKELAKTNIISQNQLYFALQGETKQSIRELIQLFLFSNNKPENLENSVIEILKMGSTSGFDMLLGILAGLEIIQNS